MAFPLFAPRRAQTAGGPAPGTSATAGALPSKGGAASRKASHGYAREAAALVLLASALYMALALTSFRGDPVRPEIVGDDWVGPAGAFLARTAVEAIGLAAWFLPIELALVASPLLNGKPSIAGVARFAGDVVVVVILASLAHVAFPRLTAFNAMPLGGAVGELFGEVARALFSQVGSYIIGLTVVALILIGRAAFSFIEWVKRAERGAVLLAERISAWARALLAAWTTARDLDQQRDEQVRRGSEPKIARSGAGGDAIIAALTEDELEPTVIDRESRLDMAIASGEGAALPALKEALTRTSLGSDTVIVAGSEPAAEPVAPPKPRRGKRAAKDDAEAAPEAASPKIIEAAKSLIVEAASPKIIETVSPKIVEAASPKIIEAASPKIVEPAKIVEKASKRAAPIEASTIAEAAGMEEIPTPSPIAPVRVKIVERAITPTPAPIVEEEAEEKPAPAKPKAAEPKAAEPKAVELKIVDTSAASATEKVERIKVVPALGQGFRLPTVDMLDEPGGDVPLVDEEQLKLTAQMLEKTLSDYGVSGKVEEIHPGPTVTTFEVSPAAGTKVSKVAGLADDLALGLSRKVRIIAPIPGKNRIGFEIPNEQRIPVSLRELVEDRRFQEMKAPLPCVLGRDIIGTPYFADLASMPHVIVAGATGAGKSVGLNVMLVSLLFRKTPAELRLLMIDPKVVELAPFDRIPHMLLPVVTDMKQAANALKWAVDEMERRYQLFANAGTKNIGTYNGWVERVQRGEARPPKPPAKVAAVAPDGTEVEIAAAKDGSDAELPEKLPWILIVVDEFADLMMQQGKDVEVSVARLAQKARAAGMHVILATQRPSVDVITGMIKANFPTRIAFRVAQKVDSRTILDEQGAEHLLGRGDMLIKMNGANDTRRVQCPFCSEEEVQRITDFLRLQGEPVYDEAILKPRDEEGEEVDTADAEADAMYDAAVRIVADTRRCSTSWIQRKLGVGYNRAAKIVEAMEKRGLVGPANGAKDREVLIAPI
jgi:DNA segregation ATPase FtsK/SpoIIIE, S-DNA-T family